MSNDVYISFNNPYDESELSLFLFREEISYVTVYEGDDKIMKSSIVMKNGHYLNNKYTVKEVLAMIKATPKESEDE